jgi:hypothetical protein
MQKSRARRTDLLLGLDGLAGGLALDGSGSLLLAVNGVLSTGRPASSGTGGTGLAHAGLALLGLGRTGNLDLHLTAVDLCERRREERGKLGRSDDSHIVTLSVRRDQPTHRVKTHHAC